jgi:DNA invertase Pin-like site-specific DNA recombinase
MNERTKITASHLSRQAIVYLRQSSAAQVEHNRESTDRQYALASKARALGWPDERVVVIDEDLGLSGSGAVARSGFARLTAEVALAHVGLVLGLEVSRLARNNAEWYRLIDLAGLTDTLIGDADGLYHPALFNDRLLLGLKGTMSEAELYVLRARLNGGIRNKAARGELRRGLPVGFVWGEAEGEVRFHPDEAVVTAIRNVFARFAETGSARRVWLWFRSEGLKFPLQMHQGAEIRWVEASYTSIHHVLTNPVYAGAYAYGKTRQETVLDAAGGRKKRLHRLPRSEWQVLIPDHHPGFVRRIFAEFAAGKSPRRIAVDLNRDHLPGPRGGEWDASTINGNATRGTGILNNELYIGRIVWNRLRYIKDPATGKRISRLNESDRWIVQEVTELRIVSQDLWDAVKERQQMLKRDTLPDVRTKPFWAQQRPRFLMTGLAKCGECGSSYVKISANLFGCAAARNRGTCSNRLNIRVETLEELILDGLRTQLMEPDLFKVFCDEFHHEVNRLRSDENAAAATKRAELDHVDRRIRRIVELITDEDAPVRALKQELVTLEARQLALQQDLEGARAPAPLLRPSLAEVYRQRVEHLHEALREDGTRDETFDLIRSLIDEIRLVPDDGQLRIELRGEPAAILALAANNKKPGGLSATGLAEQIKMVAGIGFEPTTFRLWPDRPT